MFSLAGKVAIVTGARTGLGKGMAVGLAEAGADVVIVNHSPMPETECMIRDLGTRCLSIEAELLNIESMPLIINKTIEEFGRVDILVNNAGTIRRAPSIDFIEKDWDEVVDLNLKSVFFLSQAVAREMARAGTGGKIINIASMLTFQGGIFIPSYAASKGGIGSLTKALANEWAKHKINVNAIAPGYMVTNNTEAIRKNEGRFKEISERIPAGRWGLPDDLKGAVVFLASGASNYVTGHILCVDGGWLAR